MGHKKDEKAVLSEYLKFIVDEKDKGKENVLEKLWLNTILATKTGKKLNDKLNNVNDKKSKIQIFLNDKCVNNTIPPSLPKPSDQFKPSHELLNRDKEHITDNIDLAVKYQLDGERLDKVKDKLEFVELAFWTEPEDLTVFIHEMAHAIQLLVDGHSDQKFAIKIENEYRRELAEIENFKKTGKKANEFAGMIKRTGENKLGTQGVGGRVCTI